MKKFITFSLVILAAVVAFATNPKREFRGAWLHTVHQGQYASQSTSENQKYLCDQLDRLQAAGVNVVIFQIRPSADSFYPSRLEPWSRFLSGKPGVAPSPAWDPLQFMIDECHARGMELHAWLNPYRVTTTAKEVPAEGHLYHKYPKRFIRYDGKLYFDPGQPENRKFICSVVDDIISRYDVDGIHMDDYFYPYPAGNQPFPDDASYKKYGKGMDRGDWRRKNVDMLIEELHNTIDARKPWICFGVSPFGIWRNKSSDERGSDTNGLQNYDALYADVLLWSEKGWIDYNMPQLYWELEHKAAPSLTLVHWWNKNANGRHMIIGQDVNKTMSKPDLAPSVEKSQLRHKVELSRQLENISGNCWWPGYSISKNYLGVADSLAGNWQSTVALPPTYPWKASAGPAVVKGVKMSGDRLQWKKPAQKGRISDTVRFVVYKSEKGADADIENPENILGITYSDSFTLPSDVQKGTYLIVTALDRVNNESAPSMPVKIK